LRILSSRWLKVGISLGLFIFLLRSTDLQKFIRQIQTAQPEFFFLAFLGYLASQVLSTYKWQVLARPLGFTQPFATFVVYYFSGMYLNLFAPSMVAGDVGRGVLLASNGGRVGAALQSVLADRVSGLVMLLWVSATGFLLFGPTVLPATLCYGVIAGAVLAVVAWRVLPKIIDQLLAPQHKLRRAIEKVILPYHSETAVLGRACALSFLFHLLQLALQTLLAHALNIAVPVWYLLLCIPLIHILSSLPVSFGGVGVRESGYVMFLALIGVGKDEALAFGALWSALVLGTNLVGGIALLLSPAARFSLQRATVNDRL
jgi:glycosyltransferase 2 family protein